MENVMKKIFVGNLSWKTKEDQLKEHFAKFGKVVSVKIITDQMSGKSKGFGFVEMEDADAAAAAIRELNDKPLLDRNLRVSLAQERQERTGGERPAGGGYRGFREDRGGERREFNGNRSGGYRGANR